MKMVPFEAFVCCSGAGDVVLRESYQTKTREERVRLLISSLGASSTLSYSPRPSTTPIYSPGPSTPQSYSSGPSTPPNYSSGSSRNAECSNCKHLLGNITVLKATVEMTLSDGIPTGIGRSSLAVSSIWHKNWATFLGLKQKASCGIPIANRRGSDAFYVVSPVVGVRNPMLCLQRRLVVGVDLGQMLLDALLDFWPKDPCLPLRLDLMPRRVVHRELPEDLPKEVTPMRRLCVSREA
ncbi:hypothetical protein Tco_1575072 [Tanacetum coccineum]